MNDLVAQGRTEAEGLMSDTCTIVRVTDRVFDPDSNSYVETTVQKYSGKCRVKPGGGFETTSGGTELVRHRWTVAVPMSTTGIEPDDQVTIDTSDLDDDLPGRVLAVVEVPAGSQLTARRLVCEISR